MAMIASSGASRLGLSSRHPASRVVLPEPRAMRHRNSRSGPRVASEILPLERLEVEPYALANFTNVMARSVTDLHSAR